MPCAFQYTQPGFLNEVLGLFTPGCPVDQISEEPIVILRHHSANKFRVSSPQCTRDALRLGFRHTRKGRHHGNHTLYTRWSPGIMHGHASRRCPKTFQRALPARVADSSSLAASNLASCPNRNPPSILTNHQKRFSAFAVPTNGRIVRIRQYHCDNNELVELSVLCYKE